MSSYLIRFGLIFSMLFTVSTAFTDTAPKTKDYQFLLLEKFDGWKSEGIEEIDLMVSDEKLLSSTYIKDKWVLEAKLTENFHLRNAINIMQQSVDTQKGITNYQYKNLKGIAEEENIEFSVNFLLEKKALFFGITLLSMKGETIKKSDALNMIESYLDQLDLKKIKQ